MKAYGMVGTNYDGTVVEWEVRESGEAIEHRGHINYESEIESCRWTDEMHDRDGHILNLRWKTLLR